VERPFEALGPGLRGELSMTIENAKRDGVRVAEREEGSQSAGAIRISKRSGNLKVLVKLRPEPEYSLVPLRYDLMFNKELEPETAYATIVHELGHLYCGHLGTPNNLWWPDRRGLSKSIRECEAESVCALICLRLGIQNPSARYLGPILGDVDGDGTDHDSPITLEVLGKLHELGIQFVEEGAIEFFEWSARMIAELGLRIRPDLRAAWRTIKRENATLAARMDDMGMKGEIPPISLNCVMKAAGLIEQMGRGLLSPRREKKS
jgi:hypothetical protein